MFGSAPASSRRLTASRWPYWAAQCRAVSLSPLVRLTFGILGPVTSRVFTVCRERTSVQFLGVEDTETKNQKERKKI